MSVSMSIAFSLVILPLEGVRNIRPRSALVEASLRGTLVVMVLEFVVDPNMDACARLEGE